MKRNEKKLEEMRINANELWEWIRRKKKKWEKMGRNEENEWEEI